MVRFFVDIEWNVVRLVEWHMCSSTQIERHIKEVYDFFVGFDCDFKPMLAEDVTKILLNFFCLTGRGPWLCQDRRLYAGQNCSHVCL